MGGIQLACTFPRLNSHTVSIWKIPPDDIISSDYVIWRQQVDPYYNLCITSNPFLSVAARCLGSRFKRSSATMTNHTGPLSLKLTKLCQLFFARFGNQTLAPSYQLATTSKHLFQTLRSIKKTRNEFHVCKWELYWETSRADEDASPSYWCVHNRFSLFQNNCGTSVK